MKLFRMKNWLEPRFLLIDCMPPCLKLKNDIFNEQQQFSL